jgi:hypothetical protein
MAKALESMLPLRTFKPPVELPTTHLAVMWHERYHRDPGNAWLRGVLIREMEKLYESRPG